MTNKIRLSELEIELESDKYRVQDDGFVEDMEEHQRKMYIEEEGSLEGYENFEPTYDQNGRFNIITRDGIKTIVIFYRHSDPITDIVVKGHEETHALHFMGRLDLLYDKIKQTGLDFKILLEYPDYRKCPKEIREIIADIGGIFSLERHGANILEVSLKENPGYYKATKMYQDEIIRAWEAQKAKQ